MKASTNDQSIRQTLVSENPITRRLLADGWRPADLDKVVLQPCDRSLPFMQWPFRLPEDRVVPDADPRRLRAHAALKVLMMDDLPSSAGEQEAWAFICSVTLEMAEGAYLDYGDAQQSRASEPRPRFAANGASVQDLIAQLSTCPEHRDAPPSDLWQRLETALEGCSPVWSKKTSGPRKWSLEYDAVTSVPETGEAERKTMGYQHFCRLVRAARKAKKRH